MTTSIKNPHATAKHTLTVLVPVYDALKVSAARQGLEPNEVIVDLIVNHTISAGTLDSYTQNRIVLARSLIAQAVETARRICRDGGFSETITLDAIRACTADREWANDYRAYVEDDIFKHGNPLKGSINRELGFRIKAGIGGEVKKDQDGKALNAKVSGQIIQSYTPMQSYDEASVR